jgi:hypothetical protein
MPDAFSKLPKVESVRPSTSIQHKIAIRRSAGILLVILPTVIYGGTAILSS